MFYADFTMKRFLILLVVVSTVSIFTGCMTSLPSGEKAYFSVSMVELLSDPWSFHERYIRVQGYLHFGDFEESPRLYLHKEDFLHGIYLNSYSVKLPNEVAMDKKELSDKYVSISGNFDALWSHIGLRPGGITNVLGIITTGSDPARFWHPNWPTNQPADPFAAPIEIE